MIPADTYGTQIASDTMGVILLLVALVLFFAAYRASVYRKLGATVANYLGSAGFAVYGIVVLFNVAIA